MKKKKRTLLWKIEHPALARPSFLFGTMHVRDELAFRFLHQACRHLQMGDALATEYDLSNTLAPLRTRELLLPAGQQLADFLRPAQYQKLKGILYKAFGVNIELYDRFKPLLLINSISEKLLQRDRPQALDLQLWEQAGSMGKMRLGIETLDEQLQVLQQIPVDYQVQLLRALARNVSRFRKASLRSAGLYQKADPQRLYRMVRRSSQGLRQLLIFQRNRTMAERIARIVQQQPTLCAIGAGHLCGREGVIPLLKKEGFRLLPLPITAGPDENAPRAII